MDTPDAIAAWRIAIKDELEKLGSGHAIDDIEISSMLPFEITRDKTDQTPRGKLTPTLVGTAEQITDNLKRYLGCRADHAPPVAAVQWDADRQDHRGYAAARARHSSEGLARFAIRCSRASTLSSCRT